MARTSRRKITFIEHHPFFQCCAAAVLRLKDSEKELLDLMRNTKDREMTQEEEQLSRELQEEVDMNEVAAPIFAITTAESFINIYSEHSIGIEAFHTPESLESLGLLSKWIAIPYMACGTEIVKEGHAMKEFQELISVRNSLVHAKPVRSYNLTREKMEEAGKKFENKSKNRRRIANRSDQIIVNLVSELLKIDERDELKDLVQSFGIPATVN